MKRRTNQRATNLLLVGLSGVTNSGIMKPIGRNISDENINRSDIGRQLHACVERTAFGRENWIVNKSNSSL